MSEQLGIDEVMKGEAEIEFRSQLGIAEREILDVDNDVLVDFFNSILRNMSSSNAQEVLRSLLDYMEKEKNMFNPVLYEIVSFRLKLIMNCDSMPGLSKKKIENILELNVFCNNFNENTMESLRRFVRAEKYSLSDRVQCLFCVNLFLDSKIRDCTRLDTKTSRVQVRHYEQLKKWVNSLFGELVLETVLPFSPKDNGMIN